MTRKAYITSFLVLATIFVPVDIYYLMGNLIVPCCYLILAGLLAGEWNMGGIIFGGIYIAFYLGLFYLIARITFSLIGRVSIQKLRLALQILVLLAVFSCSFLRVIVDSGYRGNSGTYNFWSATNRYFEKR